MEEGYAGDNRASEKMVSHSTVPLVKTLLMQCKADDGAQIVVENQQCGKSGDSFIFFFAVLEIEA